MYKSNDKSKLDNEGQITWNTSRTSHCVSEDETDNRPGAFLSQLTIRYTYAYIPKNSLKIDYQLIKTEH